VFGSDNDSPNHSSLTKCHTEKWRLRRVIKTKQWRERRHRRCVERRRLFACFIRDSMLKAFISRVIRKLYTTPPTLCVPPSV